MQTIQITGNIVADAELRNGRDGREFMTFRVAVNENHSEEKRTTYYDVMASRSGVMPYLKKGQMVGVVGRLSLSATCRDEKAFLNANINAYQIELLGGQREN